MEKSGKDRNLPNKSPNKRKGKPSPAASPKKKMKSLIADAVAKELKERSETKDKEEAAESQLQDYFVSMLEKVGAAKGMPGKKLPGILKPGSNVSAASATDEKHVYSLKSLLKQVQQQPKKKE